MLLKLMCVIAVTLSLVSAAPKKKTSDEHIAALFVKDSDNGELRFLTGSSNVNQLITQKQDLLEQLRPTNGANNIRPIIIDLNAGGIQTTSPTVGFGGGNGNGGVLGAVASNASPVGDLLPQIVGQVVGGGATSPTSGTGASSPSSPISPTTPGTSPAVSPGAVAGQNPANGGLNRRRVVRRGNKRPQGNRNTNKRRRYRRRPAKRNQQKRKVILLRPQRS